MAPGRYSTSRQPEGPLPTRSLVRRTTCTWAVLAPLLLCVSTGAVLASIQVTPMVVRPVVKPGQGTEFDLTVSNGDPVERSFTVALTNMTAAPQGFARSAPDDDPRGCAKWLSVSPQSFKVPPSGSQRVTCRMRVPRDARGGYYALITVASPSPERGSAVGITMTQAFASAVLLAVPGPRVAPSLKVDGLRVGVRPPSANDRGGWRVEAAVRNEGTIHAKVVGAYQLRSSTGSGISRGPLDSGSATVLASAVRVFAADGMQHLADGVYLLTAQFEVPGTRIRAAGTKAFVVRDGLVKDTEPTPEVIALLDSLRPAAEMSPQELSLALPSGGSTSRPLTLTNVGKQALSLALSCSDFQLTDVGEPEFPAQVPQHQQSARAWLSLQPQETAVAPGGRATIRVGLRVPRDTPDGDYVAALRVRDANSPRGQFYPSYAVVRVTVGRNAQPSCEIVDLSVSNPNTPSAAVTVVVRNAGPCIAWPLISLHVSDAGGGVAVASASFAAGDVMVLPGQQRRFTAPLDTILRPGKARATVNALARADGKAIQREVVFDAPAWESTATPPKPLPVAPAP